MKRYALTATALVFVCAQLHAATIPSMINYTGTVEVNSSPFNGNGLFRFAIINGHADCQAATPTTNCVTYWSHDSTSKNGGMPDAALTLTVTKGLFSIKLGDTTSMMPLPGTVFDNTQTYLRVWFADGANGNGPQRLTPDRQLIAVPYAYRAEVAEKLSGAGSITQELLAPASVTTTTIVNQAVTSDKIADGTITGTDVSSSATLNVSGLAVDGSTLNVDATNNRIGLGTNTPDSPLHIKAAGATNGLSNARILVENGAGNRFFLNTWESDKFSIGTAANPANPTSVGADILTIDGATGNVGIGTTSPGAKLHVNGGMQLGSAGFYTYAMGGSTLLSTTFSRDIYTCGAAHIFDIDATIAHWTFPYRTTSHKKFYMSAYLDFSADTYIENSSAEAGSWLFERIETGRIPPANLAVSDRLRITHVAGTYISGANYYIYIKSTCPVYEMN